MDDLTKQIDRGNNNRRMSFFRRSHLCSTG